MEALRLLSSISLVVRTAVVLNWATILGILAIHDVPKKFALSAFAFFKITTVFGTLWLIVAIAAGLAGRIRFVSIIVDCVLILPMFGFWFIVAASTF